MAKARRRVVIIDDHAALREILRLFLHANGFEVVADLPDPDSGVESTAALQPDTVLLDWDLGRPGPDGAATLARLRERAPHVPVVVFTNDGSVRQEAVALGAAAVIDKGASPSRLLAALTGAPMPRAARPESAPDG